MRALVNEKGPMNVIIVCRLPSIWFSLNLGVTIRLLIVADSVVDSYQVTRKLKRTYSLKFTSDSSIIFTHFYVALLSAHCRHR